MVVWVLSSGQNVLVAGVVGLLVQHPTAALHLYGVAAAEVGVHVRAVGVALIGAALEVSVLIKCDLSPEEKQDEIKAQNNLKYSKYIAVAGCIMPLLCELEIM